jgi:hypothetical protein
MKRPKKHENLNDLTIEVLRIRASWAIPNLQPFWSAGFVLIFVLLRCGALRSLAFSAGNGISTEEVAEGRRAPQRQLIRVQTFVQSLDFPLVAWPNCIFFECADLSKLRCSCLI